MSKVMEIEKAIESLDNDEYAELRQWFTERDWTRWDWQIQTDSETGKLDHLIKEAREEKKRGELGNL